MIIGHYAAALIPRAKDSQTPFWVYLLAANLLDFLWLIFGFLKMEEPSPASMWEATFENIRVDMLYSHGLVPTLIWSLIITLSVYLIFRGKQPALWCGSLVILHFICDLLSGYSHGIWESGPPRLGFNFYQTKPYLAIFIEALFGAACVFWYLRTQKLNGRQVSRLQAVRLYSLFIVGALVWLPTAKTPLGTIFHLP